MTYPVASNGKRVTLVGMAYPVTSVDVTVIILMK